MSRISPEAGLTIGAVAARTGLSVPVLRAWEQRFGFPRPDRLPGGHRRFQEEDVDRLLQVVADRAAGRSLESAIAAVQAGPATVEDAATIFSGLRRLRPDVPTQVLSRRTMLAISLAIEDECTAAADHAHLAAAFQTEAVYRNAEHRWERLGQTASAALVFASFERSRTTPTGIREVAIPPAAPLRREWSVVCDAPLSAAVLVGWERHDGRFEAMWSVEPAVVRAATLAARTLAGQMAPRLRLPEPPPTELWSVEADRVLQRATAITGRIVAYLDALPRAVP